MATAKPPTVLESSSKALSPQQKKLLFITCFISLITTSLVFGIRLGTLDIWGEQFQMSQLQKGNVLGAGLWPFSISMIIFSLVLNKVGYRKSMYFAFACHIISTVMTIFATGYWGLFWAAFVCSLGNGTIEAVINPLIASLYKKERTKWLNILHAGWPLGVALGVLASLFLEGNWKASFALVAIPSIAYISLLNKCRFPDEDNSTANDVKQSEGGELSSMMKEFGGLASFIVITLITYQLWAVAIGLFGNPDTQAASIYVSAAFAAVAGFGIGMKFGFGKPLFFALCVIMLPLATTEIATDGWIKDLMNPAMEEAFKLSGAWVAVASALIMMTLRFNAGFIAKRLSPPAILCCSSVLAAGGLMWLAKANTPGTIIPAVIIYAIGQTFFWPTMLGFVAERFPKGGAMTLNSIAAVGMLGVGIFGFPFLGMVQDQKIASAVEQTSMQTFQKAKAAKPKDFFGYSYEAVDQKKLEALAKEDSQLEEQLKIATPLAKRDALFAAATLPCIMAAFFLMLLLYFKSQGGYRALSVNDEELR